MLNIYKTIDGKVKELDNIAEGSWVHLCDPEEPEIARVVSELGLDPVSYTHLDVYKRQV